MAPADAPILQVRGLVKAYGYLPVLRGIDLDVQRGQFLALLGPNGSGKSTLLRLLPGLSKPTAGSITIGGWQIPQEAAAVRAQIGMVSHRALLYASLTARENLAFFGRLYGLPEDVQRQRSDDLLERVGLRARADSPVRTYSRGMQQRLSIARALLHQPHVLLLDEPYTGLDQDAAAVLDRLLRDAHAEGHTVLMSTHRLDRAALLADRIVILHRGRMAYDEPAGPLTTDQLAAHYARVTGTGPEAP